MKKMENGELERCVLCRKETIIPKNREISLRDCYVEGVGQLCRSCYLNVYGKGYR